MLRPAHVVVAAIAVLLIACSDEGTPSAADVFAGAVDSVAFVETDIATGSGIVYDGDGHVVTNYHVIEDAEEISVFPHAAESGLEAEVVGFDRRADVAVLQIAAPEADGPSPFRPADPARVVVGDGAYVIGYPLEGGSSPPTVQLTTGVVSAKRDSVLGDVPYVQTDASFNAGVSGGALVNSDGELVGMPTWIFGTDAAVGMAIEGDAVFRIAAGLIASEAGDEPFGPNEGRRVSATIGELYDAAGYRVWLGAHEHFEASLTSDADTALSLADPFDYEVAHADEFFGAGGAETVEYDTLISGPHTVAVVPFDYDTSFEISASHELRPYVDDEDGKPLSLGEPFVGELQFAGDEDTLTLELDRDEAVELSLRSWDFDVYLMIFAPTGVTPDAENDDSGGGLAGTDARIEYTAPSQGTYEVIVSYAPIEEGGELFLGSGFYRLDVEEQ